MLRAADGPRPDGAILLSQASDQVPEDPEAMEFFGNTFTAGNLSRGEKADLVVGVPSSTVDTTDGAGLEHVFYGSDDGFAQGDNQLWHPGQADVLGEPHPFERFGASMRTADLGRSNHADLFVGAPSDEVAGMGGRKRERFLRQRNGPHELGRSGLASEPSGRTGGSRARRRLCPRRDKDLRLSSEMPVAIV
jgi:hypothetical protein